MKRLLACFLLALLPVSSHAERGIIATQSYDSPLGCAPDSVFNLIAGSVLNTFGSVSAPTSLHSFNILPYYNNGQGASFQLVPNGAGNLVMATAGLQPLSYFGSLQYSTGNNPDVSNTIGTIPIESSSEVFLHGTRVTAPCNATNCLHNYIWDTSGAGPGIGTDFTIGSANAGQGTMGGISDGTYLYFLHRLITPINTTMLWKFDIAGTTTLGFLNVGNVPNRSEFVQDSTYVYFTNSSANNILRVEKLVFGSSTAFPITPTALQDPLTFSENQQAFYLATVNAGILTIRRYSADLSTNTHNLVIGNESVSPGGLMMDERANKLYLVTEPAASTIKRIRRLNPANVTTEQTLSIDLGTNGFVAAPDFTHRYLWISDVGNPSHIQRVQLCT